MYRKWPENGQKQIWTENEQKKEEKLTDVG